MNVVDVILAAVTAASLWGSWQRGFTRSAADLATLAASVAVALVAYRAPARWLDGQGFGVWAMPLAFLWTFVAARIGFGIVAGRLLAVVPGEVHRHRANRVAGLWPGAANGLIHAAVAAVLLLALPLFDGVTEQARSSALAQRLSRPAEWLEARLLPIFDPAAHATLGHLTVRPGTHETVQLPFQVMLAKPRPKLEAQMLELVNAERASAGVQPLRADADLTRVARRHSADMFARGYFSHMTPEGRDPFDRMRAADLRFLAGGENLALARSLRQAHDGLMDSPGHRANILRPAFGRLGVGVLDGGVHGLMVTQNFRD